MTSTLTAPVFAREGLGYRFECSGVFAGLTLRATNIVKDKQAVWILLGVQAERAQGWPEMPAAPKRFNLFTGSSVASTAKYYADATGKEVPGATDWQVLIDKFAEHILASEAQGVPFQWAAELPTDPEPADVVEKLIQDQQISVLFGPYGSAKGWLSMAIALCVQEGIDLLGLRVQQRNVLYIDYEADFKTFVRRMHAVAKGLHIAQPRLRWVQPQGTLVDAGDWLARMVAQEHIGLAIVDSAGHACSAPSEGMSWDASGAELFKGLRMLAPATPFVIDHVTNEGLGQKLAGRQQGGNRKARDTRVSWEVRLEQEPETDSLTVGLFHTKKNNTREFDPIGVRLDFTSDTDGRATSVRLSRTSVVESPELGKRLGDKERIVHELRGGQLSTNELSERLDIPVAQVRARCNDLRRSGALVSLGESGGGRTKAQLWGLSVNRTNRTDKPYSSTDSTNRTTVQPLYTQPVCTVSDGSPLEPPSVISDHTERRDEGRRNGSPPGAPPQTPDRVWWGDVDEEGPVF